jgi:hypothetical protein
LSGEKVIETRGYPIPKKFLGIWMAIVETGRPGEIGSRPGRAQVVGLIIFKSCYKYKNRQHWESEQSLHRVSGNDPDYAFDDQKDKWAWEIEMVRPLPKPQSAPLKRGIRYAKECIVEL